MSFRGVESGANRVWLRYIDARSFSCTRRISSPPPESDLAGCHAIARRASLCHSLKSPPRALPCRCPPPSLVEPRILGYPEKIPVHFSEQSFRFSPSHLSSRGGGERRRRADEGSDKGRFHHGFVGEIEGVVERLQKWVANAAPRA